MDININVPDGWGVNDTESFEESLKNTKELERIVRITKTGPTKFTIVFKTDFGEPAMTGTCDLMLDVTKSTELSEVSCEDEAGKVF